MYPHRARAIHLAESLRELMGPASVKEAKRRMAAAADEQQVDTALLWFDVWVALDEPTGGGSRA